MTRTKESLEINLDNGTADGILICNLKGWDREIYRIGRNGLSAYADDPKLK